MVPADCPDEQKSLDSTQGLLSESILLKHPIPFCPFVLDTDASGENIGAVLQQDPTFEKGNKDLDLNEYSRTLKTSKLRPIAYDYLYPDCSLVPVSENYHTPEQGPGQCLVPSAYEGCSKFWAASPPTVRLDL